MADPLGLQLIGATWALLASVLPCPLDAGWILHQEVQIPKHSGGYSAISYEQSAHRLWLLSDLPDGTLSAWTLLSSGGVPRMLQSLSLKGAAPHRLHLDGEALVLVGDQVWVASEGRRTSERPAQLLRFSRVRGDLMQVVPMPPAWQPNPGQGLDSNAGPESLARLSLPSEPLALLMAAERPLLQGPRDQVPLLRWFWPSGLDPRRDAPQAQSQGALRPPTGEGWGLTDLLVLHPPGPGSPQLLTLWRRYRDPFQWNNQLRLYPLPAPDAVVDALEHWDLQAMGLTPENWEGLSLGPELSPGQPSLLLVSDDNLNPLQTSRLAHLQARHSPTCVLKP
jgi:hypothetical protein